MVACSQCFTVYRIKLRGGSNAHRENHHNTDLQKLTWIEGTGVALVKSQPPFFEDTNSKRLDVGDGRGDDVSQQG